MFTRADSSTLLGLIAGILTTAAYLPQVLKTWRQKSANDISLAMISLTATGIFLWFVYGLSIGSFPVIVANLVTFVLVVAVLVLKVRYGSKKPGRRRKKR
jgi:MtN3 and saliva related transmembrane protein